MPGSVEAGYPAPPAWGEAELAEWQAKGKKLDAISLRAHGADSERELLESAQYDQMRRFLIALAAPAYGLGFMELRAIRPGSAPRIHWIPCRDIGYADFGGVRLRCAKENVMREAFAWAQRATADGCEVFSGVLPRIEQSGRKASVFQAGWAWVDVDFKLGEGTLLEREARWIHRMSTVRDPFVPDMIVTSGNGMHLYTRLDPVIGFIGAGRDAEVRRFEATLRGFQQAVQPGSDSTHDLARVLRLPGTLNQKDPKNTKNVCLVHMADEPAVGHYSPDNEAQIWARNTGAGI